MKKKKMEEVMENGGQKTSGKENLVGKNKY